MLSTVRHIRQFAPLVFVLSSCVVSTAQWLPTTHSIPELSKNPRQFDGHFVRVRAWVMLGWEGDDFLFDAGKPAPRESADFRAPSLWFYCKTAQDPKVWDTMRFGSHPVQATFTGYFHFVPDKKSRIKDVFDPGPLQLEVLSISDVASGTKPAALGPVTPRD